MNWRRVGAIILIVAPLSGMAQSYTLPIETARLLVADAMSNRIKDSIIAQQAAQISDLKAQLQNQADQFNDTQLANSGEINELVLAMNGLQESVVFEQSETRKWKNKADKRWGISVNAGYGVMSTGGEIRTGPTVNAGLSYRLLRF